MTAGDGDGCGRERADSAFSQQAGAECGVKPTRLPHPPMRRLQRQADKPHITAAMTKLRACVWWHCKVRYMPAASDVILHRCCIQISSHINGSLSR
jgi:hypothetical protein